MMKNELVDITGLFESLGITPKVIFDCGANIGFVSHQYNKNFPEAQIFSFEPNPKVFEKLDKSFASNDKVKTYNKGVGDKSGQLAFQINKNSGTSSFLPPTDYHVLNYASSNITVQTVDVISLGDFMKENNIDKIDLLKLDVEGFEIKVMEGIPALSDSVRMIFTEVNLIPTYQEQPLIEDVSSYLRANGFHLVNFYGINENQYGQAMITNLLWISDETKAKLQQKLGDKFFGY